MMQHIAEKWDSYMSVLLGILLVVILKTANPKILAFFKYYVFVMIGVVILDTIMNLGQHESMLWKFAAIASNGVVLVSCIFILQNTFKLFIQIKLPMLAFMQNPNFLVYLGIFLIIENLSWIYVYDHF